PSPPALRDPLSCVRRDPAEPGPYGAARPARTGDGAAPAPRPGPHVPEPDSIPAPVPPPRGAPRRRGHPVRPPLCRRRRTGGLEAGVGVVGTAAGEARSVRDP